VKAAWRRAVLAVAALPAAAGLVAVLLPREREYIYDVASALAAGDPLPVEANGFRFFRPFGSWDNSAAWWMARHLSDGPAWDRGLAEDLIRGEVQLFEAFEKSRDLPYLKVTRRQQRSFSSFSVFYHAAHLASLKALCLGVDGDHGAAFSEALAIVRMGTRLEYSESLTHLNGLILHCGSSTIRRLSRLQGADCHLLQKACEELRAHEWDLDDDRLRLWVHAELRATQLLLALRAYEEDQGSLPDSLSSLVPEYIEEVPRDPYDEAEFRYDCSRRLVYSVGDDLVDSGGDGYESFGPELTYRLDVGPRWE
jgi:hypothetical protein